MYDIHLNAIARRRSEISAQIEGLRGEDAELAVAEKALARLAGSYLTDPAQLRGRSKKPRALVGQPVRMSQKELVQEALRSVKPAWTDTARLIETVKEQFGVDIPRLSMGPLLSVMKRDGAIVRRGRRIAHPDRAREIRPQSAAKGERQSPV